MKFGIFGQTVIIGVSCVVLGVLNNLRSSKPLEWVKDWPSYEALHEEVEEPSSPALDPSEIMNQVISNQGITDIGIDRAAQIHSHASDLTVWIDARDQELYEKGHILGALHLDFYNQDETLSEVQAEIEMRAPAALVVYCKGKECTDSHFLAEDLMAFGYTNIFVYKDGFDDWLQAGYPIEGELASTPQTQSEPETLAEKPPGMYLEHIVRDLVPFLLGILMLVNWKTMRSRKSATALACIIAGLFFVWAGVPKILNPLMFAKSIWNYDIAPPETINIAALVMPWLEVIGGFCLIFGVFRRGGALIITSLLFLFILAVGFNVLRGHEFNCGCVSTATVITDLYLPGWNDKYLLLLRDVGLVVMSILGLYKPSTDSPLIWPKP